MASAIVGSGEVHMCYSIRGKELGRLVLPGMLLASLGLVLGATPACHLVADFDETKIERTEVKTYIFPQTSDVKGWDLLLVVDTRAASALEVVGEKVADWVQMLANSQGCGDQGIEVGRSGMEMSGSPQSNPIHVGFVSSDIGIGYDVGAEWEAMMPGSDPLLPPAGCSWHGRLARLLHPPLARPGQGGPMHPFLVLQGCAISNFLDDSGQEIFFQDQEEADLFLREAVASFWSAVSSEQSTCPFQQPLKAAVTAIDYSLYNLGFYRSEAALGVLVLTPGDDCSLNSPISLFIEYTGPEYQASLRQVSPFDCFYFGVTCDGAEPLGSPGLKEGCGDLKVDPTEEPPTWDAPNLVDSSFYGVMAPASFYSSYLKEMKEGRPALLLAVAGPDETVEVVAPGGQPALKPVFCDPLPLPTSPGIRLKAFAQTPQMDNYRSVCSQDFSDLAEQAIVAYQNQAVVRCFPDVIVDEDPEEFGVQAECDVVFVNAPGTAQEEVVATVENCLEGGWIGGFCWEIWEEGPTQECPTGLTLAIVSTYGEPGSENEMGDAVRASCKMAKR